MTHETNKWQRFLRGPLALSAAALLLALVGRAVLPWSTLFPDFVCYWASGKIVLAGQNLYDFPLQARIQQQAGWDMATTGFGMYEGLPYYYPPWFGFLCVLLVPLGFETAKFAFFFLNIEFAFLSGYLLRSCVPKLAAWVPALLVSLFVFTLVCTVMAQTALFILFMAALAWWLLDRRYDFAAGTTLIWLTHKPQLGGLLVLVLLVWAVRQRRWRVVAGFAVAAAILTLAAWALMPTWPYDMLTATKRVAPPTDYFPWIGNTWFMLLRSLGVHGVALWLLYALVAIPVVAALVRQAWRRTVDLRELFALAVLAVFWVAPYARHYDFPILVVPLLVLLGQRRPEWLGAGLLVLLVIVPYLQYVPLIWFKDRYNPGGRFLLEVSFIWIPFLLTAAWLTTRRTLLAPTPPAA